MALLRFYPGRAQRGPRFDELARRERRTNTEVFQAMLRLYQQESRKLDAAFDRRVLAAIAETEEEKRTNQKTPEALTAAFENYARYGAERAEALGLTEKEIDNLVYEQRQKRRRTARKP